MKQKELFSRIMLRYVFFLLCTLIPAFGVADTLPLKVVRDCSCYATQAKNYWRTRAIQDKLCSFQRYGVGSIITSWIPLEDQWWKKYQSRERELKNDLFYDLSQFYRTYKNFVIYGDLIQLVHDYRMEKLKRSDVISPGIEWYKQLEKENYNTHCAYQAHHDYYEEIVNEFLEIRDRCIKQHTSLQTYFDAGVLDIARGNYVDAIQSAAYLIESAKDSNLEDLLSSDHYQNLGISYLEGMQYANAIQALTEAINKNPSDQDSYFQRSIAYFEIGDFDQSIQDYLLYKKNNKTSITLNVSKEFSVALLEGLGHGSNEALIDFVPSLCHSLHGIGACLWTFIQSPLASSTNFYNTCYEAGETFINYLKQLDQDQINNLSDELQAIIQQFDHLNDSEKGRSIGYCIGKYGVDILAGGTIIKGFSSFKKLREANRLCNIEAIAVSKASKVTITEFSLKHAAERTRYFKNVDIHWGRQNKHIEGTHNYQKGKSILQHPEPERLVRTHGGKGIPVRGTPGELGYQEIINFEEHIGFNVCEKTGIKASTTWGKVHYSKDGAHIVPTMPRQ